MFGKRDFEKQPKIKPPRPAKAVAAVRVKEPRAPRAPGELSGGQKAARKLLAGLYGLGRRLNVLSRRKPAITPEAPTLVVDVAGEPLARSQSPGKRLSFGKRKAPTAATAAKPAKPRPITRGLAGGTLVFANTLEAIEQAPAGSRVVLWGEAVISDLTPGGDLGDLVPQSPRNGMAGSLNLGKSVPKLYVWLIPAHLRAARERRLTVNLAIDYALAFGLRQNRACLVIVGCLGGPEGTNVVDVLSFGAGRLVGVEQRALQSRASAYYQESVQGLISAFLNREGYEFKPEVVFIHPEVAGGMVFNGPVTLLDGSMFDRRLATSINYGFRIHTALDVIAPVAIVVGAAAGSAFVLWQDWQAHQRAVRQFQQSVHGVEDEYAKGQASLQLLQAQAQFLESPVPQKEGVKRLAALLRGVAVEQRGYIKRLSFVVAEEPVAADPSMDPAAAAAAGAAAEPSFVLSIGAPTNPDLSGIEQAKEILDAVAKSTGATVQMTAQKSEPDPSNPDLPYRVFELVGRYPPPTPETPGA